MKRRKGGQSRTHFGVTVVSAADGWHTADGRFRLVEDESTGSRAWLLYDQRADRVLEVLNLSSGCAEIAARRDDEAGR